MHARSIRAVALALLCATLFASGAASDTEDPGIRFEVIRDRYSLQAFDLATGEPGPEIAVAVGSPAHPTPMGRWRVRYVVHEPAWNPGPVARKHGAEPTRSSTQGPLGIAKLPFSRAYSLHGGATRFSVGKPITLGCLRARDEALRGLLVWLAERGALGTKNPVESAGQRQSIIRPIELVVR